jgi:uroporphyrinogen-III synthase
MSAADLTLLVTRPQPQAEQWVHALHERGQPALSLPLLVIEAPAALDVGIAQAWGALADVALLMFVSPNAVIRFFSQAPMGAPWPPGVYAGATGPGTVQALRAAGVPGDCILAPAEGSPRFDAEALWEQALAGREWAGRKVVVVRGEGGRDWLAERLRASGAAVAFLSAYRTVPTPWAAQSLALLRAVVAAPQRHVWMFTSSRAVEVLLAGLQQLQASAELASMLALATHPRIASTVALAGFGRVVSVRPQIEAVLDGLGLVRERAALNVRPAQP